MAATRLPGTPRLLRALNDRAALDLLLTRGPLTRAQLGEMTFRSKIFADPRFLTHQDIDPNGNSGEVHDLVNYDVSYVDSMTLPVAMEANNVPLDPSGTLTTATNLHVEDRDWRVSFSKVPLQGSDILTLVTAIPDPRSISELPSTSRSTPPEAASTKTGSTVPTPAATVVERRSKSSRERGPGTSVTKRRS